MAGWLGRLYALFLLGVVAIGCGEAEIFLHLGTRAPDTTPPTILDVQPPEGTTLFPGSTVSVTVVVTDNRGVEEVRLVAASIPGITFPDISPLDTDFLAPFTFTFFFPEEGIAFLTFEARDFSGNSASITVTYRIMF
ncbi:MAG: hypothetical protein D6736_15220 [Nitrospinota bacterium]|nr:MAG: hypothetical protein D6736_15220 [Nitrospinota bacterium]